MEKIVNNQAVLPPRDPILLIEDDPDLHELYKKLFKKMNIPYVIANNGSEALRKINEESFSIYIVDLVMPVMDGREFIRKFRNQNPDAIILVQTATIDSEIIISVMKMGVFDYITKPFDQQLIQDTIWKALDYLYLKESQKMQAFNSGLKIKNQIEWLNYKESRKAAGKDDLTNKSIATLKDSLSSWAGIGSMISLIEMLKDNISVSKDNSQQYLVDKAILDLLLQNNVYCLNMINGLREADAIIKQDADLQPFNASNLLHELNPVLNNLVPYLAEKSLTFNRPTISQNCPLNLDLKIIRLMLEEMLINAVKYSQKFSTIQIFSHISQGYFWLSVKNQVSEEPYGGVPQQYEKMVVEPFFRLHSQAEGGILQIEKFGFGLGLTIVENIIRKHGGLFFIHDLWDHTTSEIKPCTVAEVLFPIANISQSNVNISGKK